MQRCTGISCVMALVPYEGHIRNKCGKTYLTVALEEGQVEVLTVPILLRLDNVDVMNRDEHMTNSGPSVELRSPSYALGGSLSGASRGLPGAVETHGGHTRPMSNIDSKLLASITSEMAELKERDERRDTDIQILKNILSAKDSEIGVMRERLQQKDKELREITVNMEQMKEAIVLLQEQIATLAVSNASANNSVVNMMTESVFLNEQESK